MVVLLTFFSVVVGGFAFFLLLPLGWLVAFIGAPILGSAAALIAAACLVVQRRRSDGAQRLLPADLAG